MFVLLTQSRFIDAEALLPWAMVIHFAYASLAYAAMMSSFRLDTTTFWAFEKHLTLFET